MFYVIYILLSNNDCCFVYIRTKKNNNKQKNYENSLCSACSNVRYFRIY